MITKTKTEILKLFALGVLVLVQQVVAAAPPEHYLEDDFQTWQIVSLRGHVHGRVLGYLDIQNNEDVQDKLNTHQHEAQLLIRPAVGYDLGKGFSVWQGYGWTPSHQPVFRNEHQLWQQLLVEHKFKRLNLVNRTRLEERFISDAGNTPLHLRNLTRVSYPLGKSQKWAIVLYDELFVNLNFAQNLPGPRSGLDQNWTFAGINRKFNKHINIDLGYLGNYVNRRGPGTIDRWNHVLMIGLNLNIN